MKRTTQAFTLVELLVVISIISLLASVVLASLNTSREKGRIGAARYFAAQVDHVAGEQAVGIWNFDECSGSTVTDTSGFANTGSLTGSPGWPTDTFSGTGCYLTFDGTTNYANLGNGSSLNVTGSFTLSLWVKYTNAVGYGFIVSKSTNGNDGGFELFRNLNQGTLRFSSCAVGGSCADPYFDFITPLAYNDGKWHHVAAVYEQGVKGYIYVDGAKVVTSGNNPSAATLVSSSSMFVGARGATPSASFIGSVDNVRLYAKALIASDIENLYAQEKSFYLAANP